MHFLVFARCNIISNRLEVSSQCLVLDSPHCSLSRYVQYSQTKEQTHDPYWWVMYVFHSVFQLRRHSIPSFSYILIPFRLSLFLIDVARFCNEESVAI